MGSQSNLPERTIYRTGSSKIFSWMTSPFTLLYFTLLYLTSPHYLVPLASISLIWLYKEQPCPVPFILALLYSSWLIFYLLCPAQSCPIPRCALYATMRFLYSALQYVVYYFLATSAIHTLSSLLYCYFLLACHEGYSKPAMLALVGSIIADFCLY